ncbi:VCBS repeat-containing protein [candidate division KSB1 bacterium]|nr:VCBS repeat-containing protein [candidate division KSB1 bacterium]
MKIKLWMTIWLTAFGCYASAQAQQFVRETANFIPVKNSCASWGDFDRDGDLDVIITGSVGNVTTNPSTMLYRNSLGGKFEGDAHGLIQVEYSSVDWGDYDNDGDVDLIIAGRASIADGGIVTKIYRNDDDGIFSDIQAMVVGVENGRVSWGDVDNDGLLDVLICGDAGVAEGGFTTRIYRNEGDQSFSELPVGFVGVDNGFAGFIDYDKDADFDVLVVGITPAGRVSKMYRNDGWGMFTKLETNITPVDNGTIAFGDLDNDGDQDVLVTGDAGVANGGRVTKLFRNNGDHIFTDISISLPIVDKSYACWGDIDNDGDADIVLSGSNNSGIITSVFENNQNTGVTDIQADLVGVEDGYVHWVDYNRDGSLDLLVTGSGTAGTEQTVLYKNVGVTANLPPSEPTNLRSAVRADSIIFQWDAATDDNTPQVALNYNIRVGSWSNEVDIKSANADPSMGNLYIIGNGNAPNRLSWVLTELNPGTYYWSVQAIDGAYMPSMFAAEKEVTVGGGSSEINLMEPTDGAIDVSTNVELKWTGPAASTYRAQVARENSFANPVWDDDSIPGQSAFPSSLNESTTYYWRVGITIDATMHWSTTWSFSTTGGSTTLDPPVHSAPADGQIGVSTSPTLVWEPASGATSYGLDVSSDYSFSDVSKTVLTEIGILGTSKQLYGLAEGTTYYWRVYAQYADGMSTWSDPWSFTTAGNSVVLNPPTLASPNNGASGIGLEPVLVWNEITNALSYSLQVSEDAFASMIVYDVGLNGTSKQIFSLQNGTTYYWRVNANYTGGTSAWSEEWTFTTEGDNATPAPTLNSPPNNEVNVSRTPQLIWNVQANATSYNLEVSSSNDFTNIVHQVTNITTTNHTIPNELASATTYFWHVSANYSNGTSPWSPARSFTTSSGSSVTPDVPQLDGPQNNAFNLPLDVTLVWQAATDAVVYHLQIATDEAFEYVIRDIDSISGTSKIITGLEKGYTYYWRVNAANGDATSNWSAVWKFHTILHSPPMFFPPNNAQDISIGPEFIWGWVSNTETYHLEISKNSDLMNLERDITTLSTDTSRVVKDLEQGTQYFWRVAAVDADGNHFWSSKQTFTTYTYQEQIVLNSAIEFPTHADPAEYKPTDFRLMGIPGASNLHLPEIMAGEYGKDWEAYWDNGSANDYFEKYDDSDKFNFVVGRAFWVLNNGVVDISKNQITAAPLNANDQTEIPLHTGWNLITNPFNKTIEWNNVKAVNGITDPIYRFKGSFQLVTVMEPFEGFYYFNANNAGSLFIPFTNLLAKKSSTNPRADYEWQIQLMIQSDNQADNLAWLGIADQATDQLDRFDCRKPRTPGDVASVSFQRPQWDADYSCFASDIRSAIDEYQAWDFDVRAAKNKSAALAIAGVEQIPPQYDVYLVDQTQGIYHNLRENPAYHFRPMNTVSTFQVIIGLTATVNEQLKSVVPSQFAVEKNYPNPFNMATTIQIAIAKDTDVELKIYNLLGQEMRTLHVGFLSAGRYNFTWNGTSQRGDILPTGVYFYRFVTGAGYHQTGKMIMLK